MGGSVNNVAAGTRIMQSFDGIAATGKYLRFTITGTWTGWQPYLREISFNGNPNKGPDMCYSCIGCHDVDYADTNTVAREEDQTCFTAIYANSNLVIRGVVQEQYNDGECEISASVARCYCSNNQCNSEHVPNMLAQNGTRHKPRFLSPGRRPKPILPRTKRRPNSKVAMSRRASALEAFRHRKVAGALGDAAAVADA